MKNVEVLVLGCLSVRLCHFLSPIESNCLEEIEEGLTKKNTKYQSSRFQTEPTRLKIRKNDPVNEKNSIKSPDLGNI